jgi:hypothetical protein
MEIPRLADLTLVAGLSGAAGQPRRTLRQEVLGEWWMMMG